MLHQRMTVTEKILSIIIESKNRVTWSVASNPDISQVKRDANCCSANLAPKCWIKSEQTAEKQNKLPGCIEEQCANARNLPHEKWANSFHQKPIAERLGVSRAIWNHSVICHPTQVNPSEPQLAKQAGTQLTYPTGIKGWGSLHVSYIPRQFPVRRRSPTQVANRVCVEHLLT